MAVRSRPGLTLPPGMSGSALDHRTPADRGSSGAEPALQLLANTAHRRGATVSECRSGTSGHSTTEPLTCCLAGRASGKVLAIPLHLPRLSWLP